MSHVLCNIVVIAAADVVVVVAAGHTLVGWTQSDISHIKKISSRIIFLFLFKLFISLDIQGRVSFEKFVSNEQKST